MNTEDNCSVGESVKMRGRWLAEEQRRRAAEKLRLLKEEESRIAKMKAKLDKRKRKEERRKRDRERMERGNRELNMNSVNFSGEESFLDVQPVNSSTQKTVMFNKELTKIRNISPVGSENLIEIVDQIENKRNKHDNKNSSDDLAVNEILDINLASEEVMDNKNVPCFVESQQVFLPTQPTPKSRRKVKKSVKLIGNERQIVSYPSVEGFDAILGVECLLLSGQLSPSEFSLPKEYTSLKLEKIRENKVLSQSLDFPSQSLLSESRKRKRKNFENDSQQSPKRKVKSSHMIRKRLVRTPSKVEKKKMSHPNQESAVEVANLLFEKCSDGQFSVIACISAKDINVWVCHLSLASCWINVAQFRFDRRLLDPFLIVERDTIRIKSFNLENNQLKETSFVIMGDNGDFSEAVTSTQNVLVLTETVQIDNIVVEKYDSRQVIVFHNLDKYSRGSVVTYEGDQVEVKFLATLPGCTKTVKRLDGTEKIFLSFLSNVLYFWDINVGICVKTIDMDHVFIHPCSILKVVYVSGLINFFHHLDDKLKISVLRKRSYKEVASFSLKEPMATNYESNPSCLFSMNRDNMDLFLGNVCFNWNMKDQFIKSDKIENSEDFHKFLPFMI